MRDGDSRQAGPPEKRIPRAEVERLDAGRSAVGRGTPHGLVIDLAVGGWLRVAYGPDIGEPGDAGVLYRATLIAPGGTTAGYPIGYSRPVLQPLYP